MYQCVGLGMPHFCFITLGRNGTVELDKELEERIERELDSMGYELVKIEGGFSGRRQVLRIFIDRSDEGVTVDDCVRATKTLSLILDGVETIPGPYNLEISSPGFARPLTKPAHFERFRGERARVEYFVEGGLKMTGVGAITGASDVAVTISIDGTARIIPFERILKANLHPEERGISMDGCAKKERRGKGSGKRL
jgi:ribosome maturation factor RimP